MVEQYKQIPTKYESTNDVDECQILGGIDTLYFFVDTNSDLAPTKLYQNLWLEVNNGSFFRDGYTFLNFSGKKNGFIGGWYSHIGREKIPLFRIGFKNPDKQKQVKNVFVQFEASGIYSLGFYGLLEYVKMELSILLGYEVTNDNLFPSRADLNAFVDGFDFGSISSKMFRHCFKHPTEISDTVNYINQDDLQNAIDNDLKSFEFSNRSSIETLYLGDRGSPLYFKIYDKKKELLNSPHALSAMVKRNFLESQGFNSDHVWNVEFTIKRAVLLQYGVETLTHLLISVDSIFKDLMSRNAFLGFDLENISKNRINKNISKLPLHPIWEKISSDYNFCNYDVDVQRVYKTYKLGSKQHSISVILRELKRQIEFDQSFTLSEITNLYYESQNVVP